MPAELFQQFIGKVCAVRLFNGEEEHVLLQAVQGNWLQVERNGEEMLINGDLVRSVTVLPEKYQEAYHKKYRR